MLKCLDVSHCALLITEKAKHALSKTKIRTDQKMFCAAQPLWASRYGVSGKSSEQVGNWQVSWLVAGWINLANVQRSAKVGGPGLVNFITAVAYHICPSLPAAFTQPDESTLADLSIGKSSRQRVGQTSDKLSEDAPLP